MAVEHLQCNGGNLKGLAGEILSWISVLVQSSFLRDTLLASESIRTLSESL